MRTPYAKLRAYTVWSVVAMTVVFGLVGLAGLTGDARWLPALPAFLVALVCLCVSSAWLGATMSVTTVEGGQPSRVQVGLHVVAAVAAVSLALFAVDPRSSEPGPVGLPTLVGISVLLALMPAATRLGSLGNAALVVIVSAAVASTIAWGAPSAVVVPTVTMAVWVSMLCFAGIRMSVWILQLGMDQVRAEEVGAQLAVAEERLRFSRDLHDIFGRTLTIVAVRSDLAAELASSGHSERAAAEMRAVHALSQEALGEVRGVVAGYRAPDLATELAGARSLLEASGVAVRTIGTADDVAPDLREPFAWLVREAGTNILRHASPRHVTMHLAADAVRVENDGVRGEGAGGGSGIAGLRDRLAASGLVVEADDQGGRFVLSARREHA